LQRDDSALVRVSVTQQPVHLLHERIAFHVAEVGVVDEQAGVRR
jgi:hypothetical protein